MTVAAIVLTLAALALVPAGVRLVALVDARLEPPRSLVIAVVPAALLLVLSFRLLPGPAAGVLAVPWLVTTGGLAAIIGIRRLRGSTPLRPNPGMAIVAAFVFLAISGSFAVIDRLGAQPFGFAPTVILLTAVHFTYAGFLLVLAGALAFRRRPRTWVAAAIAAVVVGIPVTAIGFFGVAIADWTGAVLTATGGLGIGLATISIAPRMARRTSSLLAVVAGVSLLLAMPLAIAYATATLVRVAGIDIDTMARVHGSLNAFGFATAAMIAWTLERRALGAVEPVVSSMAPARSRLGVWALGLLCGAVIGVGVLVAGPLVGVLGIAAVGVLIAGVQDRAIAAGGAALGLGAAWTTLFAAASSRCGEGCAGPDMTPWLAGALVVLVVGAALTTIASIRSTMGAT